MSANFTKLVNGHKVEVCFEVCLWNDYIFNEEHYDLAPGQVSAFFTVDGEKLDGLMELQGVDNCNSFTLEPFDGTSTEIYDLINTEDLNYLDKEVQAFMNEMQYEAGKLLRAEVRKEMEKYEEENGDLPEMKWMEHLDFYCDN